MHRAWQALITAALLLVALPWPAAPQGTVMPYARIQLLTNTGAVCASCELNVYQAGTTTRTNTYSDSTLSTANANPVVLDSAGRAIVYLTTGTSYRFILTNSGGGTTYWDQDNITAVPGSSGNLDITATAGEALSAGDVVYLSDGTGSLTTGRWYRTDSDNAYSSSTAGLIGFATAAISSAATGTVRIAGRMTGLSGLTAGELYYASATAAALTASPPANGRFVGEADSTSTLVLHGDAGAVVMPDSDGTHRLALITTSNLTADRRLAILIGDTSRQITLSGDATVSQDYSVTGTPGFNTVGVSDSDATHMLSLETTSDLTANRQLTLVPGDAARTVTISGNTTISQDYSSAGSPTFTGATISGGPSVCVGCSAVIPYTATVANVSNTGTETVALSFSVPANDMATGDHILVRAIVLLRQNSGVNRTMRFDWNWGGTDANAGQVLSLVNNVTERTWVMQFFLARDGTRLLVGPFDGLGSDSLPEFHRVDGAASLTANNNVGVSTDPTFTVTTTVELRVTLSAADATFYFNPQSARVYRVRAP